ncbi:MULTISPECIES: hypothetical protein [Rhodococcus]|jgi:hypothetical protein|uniref:hypothetical protein n=1 Tax=Rhodococcus TaxID=1827 RepID=UPI0013A52C15|nr:MULTISPECIES: hypothetical protein [Rhodococcus]QTJ71237.1 hypothetical protein HYG77_38540 [Rhodococcus sp. ZPP]
MTMAWTLRIVVAVRLVKQRSTMVKRRDAVYARLDALVELLGPRNRRQNAAAAR